jgi:hypothetical protein
MPTVNAYGSRKVATEAIPGVRRTAAETPESEGAGFQQARAQALGQIGQVGGEIYGAARAVWQQHQQIRLEELKRADDIAVLNAENQLSTWENTRIYGPTGALTQQGKNAFGLPEQIATEYQHKAGEIGITLGTERQRDAFQRVALNRGANLDLTIRRHVYGEMQKYQGAEAQAGVENAANAAIANATDPRRVGVELANAEAIINTHAPQLGLGPDAIAEQIGNVRTKVHVGVIESLLAQDQAKGAQVYFEEMKGQINGEAYARIEKALDVGTTQQAGLEASEALWQAHGPKNDLDPINLDTMETAARQQFKDDPKTLDATIKYLRERKSGVDAARKDRDEANANAVWVPASQGATVAQITKMPEFLRLSGKEQVQITDYIVRKAEHEVDERYQAEARAAAREGRAYQAEVRADAAAKREQGELERSNWAWYWAQADPKNLVQVSEADLNRMRGDRGDDHINRLIAAKRTLDNPETFKNASLDADMFKAIAQGAGLNAYKAKTEEEKATLGELQNAVEQRIINEQIARKRNLTRDEKETLMHTMVDQRVLLNEWGRDPERIPALVKSPEDRAHAYVPYGKIPPAVTKDYLNYVRGFPGAERMTDAELTQRFSARIGRAYALRLLGGSNEEIIRALRGQE